MAEHQMPELATPESLPFWQALARNELALQKCGSCGKVRHYPRVLCDQCQSDEVTWVPASRTGVVHSWSTIHHPYSDMSWTHLPMTLVLVDLPEGVRLVGRWLADIQPQLGQPVTVSLAEPRPGEPAASIRRIVINPST